MAGAGADENVRDPAPIERFRTAWAEGRPAPIEQFLPDQGDSAYLSTLEALIAAELDCAWNSWKEAQQSSSAPGGETIAGPPPVESYLERFPILKRPEIVLRLVEREHAVRARHGEPASAAEYRRRFPGIELPQAMFDTELPAMSRAGSAPGEFETVLAGGPAGGGGGPPAQFGNYELLGELGRGGMGVVYRARQRSANRVVALKVIRRDRLEALPRDTQTSAIDRFRNEAQAAAQLEHDHIVTVYEVGQCGGEHFFSMRYVEGRSLAEILRGGPIGNRKAAGYLEPVARAVHEAHLRGILHRDLKPQNILVDGKTDRALVADFGLAKLSEGQEELTRAGEIMGTPSYMSPEQARDSAHVTAKTDVYALGATLYHLLAGRPPFYAATPLETLRQVIDQEPVPPRQLNPAIDRDLETVCLKCLQKEPARRYDSAAALADDLKRYLGGEPILARPIGPLGRTWRWCRRNPVVASLITLAVTLLVMTVVATSVGYVTASAARRRAELSDRQSREAVNTFFTMVAEDTLLNQPGMQPLQKKLLAEALGYYRQFLDQRGDDPALRDEMGVTLFRVGRITEKIDGPEKALPYYRRAETMQESLLAEMPDDAQRIDALGDTQTALGKALLRMKRPEQSIEAFRDALGIRQRLAGTAAANSEYERKLANAHMNLGLVEKERGQPEAAAAEFDQSQQIRQKILQRDPKDQKTRRDMAMGFFNLAQVAAEPSAARTNREEAAGLFEEYLVDSPKDLEARYCLGTCYRDLAAGRATDGRRHAAESQRLAARSRQSADQGQTEEAEKLRGEADQEQQKAEQEWDAAEGLYAKALDRIEFLALANPDVPDYQAALAALHMNLAGLERERKDPQAALASYGEAVRILRKLAEQLPGEPRYRCDLGSTLLAKGFVEHEAGQTEAAWKDLDEARTRFARLVEQFPKTDDYRQKLKLTEQTIAGLHLGPAGPP